MLLITFRIVVYHIVEFYRKALINGIAIREKKRNMEKSLPSLISNFFIDYAALKMTSLFLIKQFLFPHSS